MTTVSEIKDDHLRLLTVAEVAAELGVSRWVVYRIIRAGELTPVHWGLAKRKQLYVARRELERYRKALTKPRKAVG